MPVVAPVGTREEAVVTKAVVRAAEKLGLTKSELARVIGTSKASVTRMADGGRLLGAASKEFDLATGLIRVFRSLDAITGGDEASNRSWMRAPNLALGGVPAEMILTVTGLVHVIDYLDDRRARV